MTIAIALARARADKEIAAEKVAQEKEDRMIRIEAHLKKICNLLDGVRDEIAHQGGRDR